MSQIRIKTSYRPLQKIKLQSDHLGLAADTAGYRRRDELARALMLHIAHGVGESTLISAILVDLLRIIDAPKSSINGFVNIIASVESLAMGGTVKFFAVYLIFDLQKSYL